MKSNPNNVTNQSKRLSSFASMNGNGGGLMFGKNQQNS